MEAFKNKYEMINEDMYNNISLIKNKKTDNLCIRKKIFINNEKDINQAENEAKILKNLDHKNIVKYYESFKDKKYFFIIMEYCGNEDLRKFIEKYKNNNKYIDQNTINSIVLDICSGLKEIHQKNIIHRDLKPENIFISKDNIFKIGDFGISKKLDGTIHAKTFGGTKNYVAPELLKGQKYDKKVDIWALGCIIYELFTLKPCFDPSNGFAMVNKIISGDYEKISLKKYGTDWQDLIDSLLQIEPKNRPDIEDVYHKVNELKKKIPKMDNDKKISFSFAGIFKGCKSLEVIDLSRADTHRVFDYSGMCQDCVKLNSIKLPTIYNANSKMDNMFENCYNLKEIYLKTSQERMRRLVNLRNNQNNKGEIKPNREIRIAEDRGKEKGIDNVIKVYLKSLFRGLKGIQNRTYARAYVVFLENCHNKELSQLNNKQIDELFYALFFRNGNETFDQYFKKKILYFLLQKYKKENLNKEEIEQSYRTARRDMEIIYYKFRKKPHKLFLLHK